MNTLANPGPSRGALTAALRFFLIFVANAFAQEESGGYGSGTRHCDRFEHSDSGRDRPNPVDTYRPADLEKLGIRNATDLTTFLPQEAGGTTNLNISNGGLGTVQFNLRGLLPKETLVPVDGRRVPYAPGGAGSSAGVNINLIPFVFVDHIDILKDGASAVYRVSTQWPEWSTSS